MTIQRLAVATMCSDKKGEPELVLAALDALSQKGYRAFIADGGSSPEFVGKLTRMGHRIAQIDGGLTYQHRDAIQRAAASAPNVLYMEPDKLLWVNEGLEESVDEFFASESDMSLVCRTPEQTATFPEHQQLWEGRLNYLVGLEIGVPGDFTYGPRFFPSKLAPHLNQIQGNQGWASLLFLLGRAKKLGRRIGTTYHASSCPVGQRKEPNEDYRRFQFNCNVKGLYLGLDKPVPEGLIRESPSPSL